MPPPLENPCLRPGRSAEELPPASGSLSPGPPARSGTGSASEFDGDKKVALPHNISCEVVFRSAWFESRCHSR